MIRQLTVPILILGVLASLLVPLPSVVIDFLLVGNIVLALVLLVSTLYISEPLKLSSLPSMLLLATLYRLALNISTTRLILGSGEAGTVIEAFGNVVVQGNLVVGAVIFLVITLIQFIVIAKGAERVAEVSARFTLDALPGKQMSIDADVRAGLIDFEEARKKRQALQTESRFYGALDGAMKFVKGDAIAGIIITAINVVGGLCIGVMVMGLDIDVAVTQFTLLTIGDGLLSQIPALLNSLAAGMIVTRVVGEEETSLAEELLAQIGQLRIVKILIGIVSCALGCTPGLPMIPFMTLGIILFVTIAFDGEKGSSTSESEGEIEEFEPRPPAVLEVVVDKKVGAAMYTTGKLPQEIDVFRREVYRRHGLILAPPEFRVDTNLDAEFQVAIRGVTVATRKPAEDEENLLGVLTQTLLEVVDGRAIEFIDDILTRRTLDQFDPHAPELVSAVVPNIVSVTQLTEILKGLMKEGVSIRNFDVILQAVAEHGPKAGSERAILEEVRVALRRVICESVAHDGRITGYILDPLIDLGLMRVEREGESLCVDHITFISSQAEELEQGAVIITSKAARRVLQECLELRGVSVPVIAQDELVDEIPLAEAGVLQLPEGQDEDQILEQLVA